MHAHMRARTHTGMHARTPACTHAHLLYGTEAVLELTLQHRELSSYRLSSSGSPRHLPNGHEALMASLYTHVVEQLETMFCTGQHDSVTIAALNTSESLSEALKPLSYTPWSKMQLSLHCVCVRVRACP